VNACGKCVSSHENVVRQKGMTEEVVNAAIRVTSVIHAIGVVLDGEKASPTPQA
jgi:alkyl hydroperoxide reductase subunit D